MDTLTASQRAGRTNHERHERRKAEFRAQLHDRQRAIEICREIRDNPATDPATKIRAIEILRGYAE